MTSQFWHDTSLGAMDYGGSQCQVLHLLTGRNYKSFDLKKHTEQRVSEILSEAMKKGVPVGLASKDHTLSIKLYDRASHVVTILNPWGTSDKYKLPQRDVDVQMDTGFFQIPLAEMRRCFATINVPEGLVKSSR